jgi:hypothetical protein
MDSEGFPDNDPRCYKLIPPHILGAIDAWAEKARPCGGFVTACLTNDLTGAVSQGDLDSLRAIPAIVAYLYNEVPSVCWGTKEKVKAWGEQCSKSK